VRGVVHGNFDDDHKQGHDRTRVEFAEAGSDVGRLGGHKGRHEKVVDEKTGETHDGDGLG